MPRALVLNVTYEPLSIVASRRAACLVLDDKAELVEHDGTELRSVSMSLPRPSVVRLRYLVRAPFRRTASVSRRSIFARDDFCCQFCGCLADSIDHVLPRSRGGAHVWENVVAACRPCNLRKGDRTPEEAGMALARPPRMPRQAAWVMVGTSRVPETWKPYLTAIA
jgi:5-methylcytosine-specific restriction endonuclease McrA